MIAAQYLMGFWLVMLAINVYQWGAGIPADPAVLVATEVCLIAILGLLALKERK